MVILVEGPRSNAVAGWIEDRLSGPDTLEEEQAFRGVLRSRGVLPLHLAAASAARDARLIACAHAAAGSTDVDGALLVDLQKTPAATRVHLWKMDMRPGGAVVESDITLPVSASVLDEARAILAIVPPATPAAELPAPPPLPSAAPAPVPRSFAVEAPLQPAEAPQPDRVAASLPADRAAPLLELQAALGVGMRHFSYVDRVTPSLRPYVLPAAPLASIAASVYPLAFTRAPVLRDLGVTGDYAQAFAISSEDSAGSHVGTTWQSFDVGATERLPLTRALGASISVSYGGDDFKFDQSLAGGAAELPSVAYRFVRAGGDVRVAFLSTLSAYGGGSYLDILATGYTAEIFPRESVGGVEGHLGASWLFARSWEVSLGASYTRVFYAVNPVPGDASVAGGALDEQTRILAGLAYVR
jgi:hypothetical protein